MKIFAYPLLITCMITAAGATTSQDDTTTPTEATSLHYLHDNVEWYNYGSAITADTLKDAKKTLKERNICWVIKTDTIKIDTIYFTQPNTKGRVDREVTDELGYDDIIYGSAIIADDLEYTQKTLKEPNICWIIKTDTIKRDTIYFTQPNTKGKFYVELTDELGYKDIILSAAYVFECKQSNRQEKGLSKNLLLEQ